jgi:ribosome-associated protein
MTGEPRHHEDLASTPSGVELAHGVFIDPGKLAFRATRSPGPGGQNVNKRSTKVELRLLLSDLPIHPAAIARLRRRVPAKITDDGELLISCSEHRSQAQNKDACLDQLRDLVAWAVVPPKVRRPTKPTRSSKVKRMAAKQHRSKTKQSRSGRLRDDG